MMKKRHPKSSMLKSIKQFEKSIVELKEWSEGKIVSKETEELVGLVKSAEERDKKLNVLMLSSKAAREESILNDKLYLSEIIEKEKIKLEEKNILILAPVGSGKTTLIEEILEKDPQNALMLVSNTALKESVAPVSDVVREEKSNNVFTTKNKKIYGNKKYKMHVMTYFEFGERIRYDNDFLEDFKYIFCDEIHSLPVFQSYGDSASLALASKSIFAKQKDKQIFYFTATDEYFKELEKKSPKSFFHIKKHDFRNHPEIQKYMPLSEYRFNHIEQIRHHLRARFDTFSHFGYKCLAFSKKIEGQKAISKMAIEEGFNPIVLWSVNNEQEMTEEQLKCREHLLTVGEIPEPYNFLIINSSMQEGWNLKDPMVKLAIMNTTSETEKIQAIGRIRHDVDILAYRVDKNEEVDFDLLIPSKYLNKNLTTKERDELCKDLSFTNSNGLLMKWKAIKGLIVSSSAYHLDEGIRKVGEKRSRVSVISIKKDSC